MLRNIGQCPGCPVPSFLQNIPGSYVTCWNRSRRWRAVGVYILRWSVIFIAMMNLVINSWFTLLCRGRLFGVFLVATCKVFQKVNVGEIRLIILLFLWKTNVGCSDFLAYFIAHITDLYSSFPLLFPTSSAPSMVIIFANLWTLNNSVSPQFHTPMEHTDNQIKCPCVL